MASVTLTTLRTRVRERADMVGSSFIDDSATGLDAYINEANQRLHGLLVDALGEEYVSSTSSFTTASGTADYALPSGFYKLYGVDLNFQGEWRTLLRFEQSERNAFREVHPTMLPRYNLVGSNLRLYPATTNGLSGVIRYAPEATILVNGSDTVNYTNGWEKYVVVDAAIQALLKEETDVRGLVAERERIEREIQTAKENRDMSMPKRVVDMELVELESDLLWR